MFFTYFSFVFVFVEKHVFILRCGYSCLLGFSLSIDNSGYSVVYCQLGPAARRFLCDDAG